MPRIAGLLILCWCAFIGVEDARFCVAAADSPGWAADPPAVGLSVKVGDKYMVPYKVKLSETVSFEMLPIPGGKFKLGSPETEVERLADEGPQVEVEIAPFWMGKCEVSWGEYKLYMNSIDHFINPDGKIAAPLNNANLADAVTAPSKLYEPTYTFEHGDQPNLPAVTMSQFGARQYTKWLTGRTGEFHRLPNEAEWEYACRAGSGTAYHFGDDPAQLAEYAWTAENSEEKPHPVGGKLPNAWGLHDMHGNVMEWTLDAYTADGYKHLSQPGTGLALTNWPTKLYPRVLRGGSFEFDPPRARSAARIPSHDKDWHDTDPNRPKSPWWLTDDPARGVGMRVIRPVDPPTDPELRKKCWEIDNELTELGVTERLKQGRGSKGVILRMAEE
jgi:formylglycine-generating enzyme required for sulfatase activity